jgi:hypothetical protein
MEREETVNLHERNRRLLRILLGVMAALVIASLLVGIRW